jgi:hypothetical protein
MKYIICLSLLLPAQLFAQTTDSIIHGIGLFAETNVMSGNSQNAGMATVGLQYCKKMKGHLLYNISLGYGSYNDHPAAIVTSIKGDTVISRSVGSKIDLAVLGFGLEAQHQFYRKLYFFGGVQLRIGYGSGTTDTNITQQYNETRVNPVTGATENGITTFVTAVSGPSATMFYGGFTPYFGLKLEFKRFTIGTSFMNYFTVRSINVKGRSEGNGTMSDFDSNNLSQRFYVNYKF